MMDEKIKSTLKIFMNKLLYAIILCVSLYSCNQKINNKTILESNDIVRKDIDSIKEEVKVDSTINKILLIRDDESIKKFYSDYENLCYIDIIGHPYISFINNNATQYLLAYTYEGDIAYSFSSFEIGYIREKEEKQLNSKTVRTKYKDFETESGIRLGMTLSDLVYVKGSDYTIKYNNSDSIIIFNIDENNSGFVRRYSMATYVMEYTIKKNKIQKIYFGFEYP